jgi:hypothetical protein
MSVNNSNQYTEVNNEIHGDYKFSDSSFVNTSDNQAYAREMMNNIGKNSNSSVMETYSIPLDFIRRQISLAEKVIMDTIKDIEDLMKKVFINPNLNTDLLISHQNLWNELNKTLRIESPETIEFFNKKINNSSYSTVPKEEDEKIDISFGLEDPKDDPYLEDFPKIINDDPSSEDADSITIQPYPPESNKPSNIKISIPFYICYDQVSFAERMNSTISRKFLQEYEQSITHSTFSYFFQFRKLLNYLLNEVKSIQVSLLTDFGDAYENELQQKIAVHYDSWGKTALHYTSRIAKTIISKPGEIPGTELDQISKEQASKFQAFFAIKLNAVNSEIEDILSSLKRDLHDNSEIFYTRYIKPGLKFSSEISNPLELDYQTTSVGKSIPFLAEELLIASVLMKGNFTSVVADIIDRHNIVIGKTDALLRLIHEKRKYANFIAQMSFKGVQKPNVLLPVSDDWASSLFRQVVISPTRKDDLKSSHSLLQDLDEDHHPQYLLKDGGRIIGDILVAEGVTIDGVDLNQHKHTGTDGSTKISSLDIDYETARNSDRIKDAVTAPISIAIAQFNVDIVNGVPRCDAVVNIEIDDNILDNHEYEIIYTEVT